ncbi:hypothetical protein M0Q50_10030 [bacterium]|jgi:hypothetical protein|nr:hypothetical protein [bacterium]
MKILKSFDNFSLNEELSAKQKKLPKGLQAAILKKQGKSPKKDDEDADDDKKTKKDKKCKCACESVSNEQIETLFENASAGRVFDVEMVKTFKNEYPAVVKNKIYTEKLMEHATAIKKAVK